MTEIDDCILEMRQVVKTFPGVRALDGVNLSVRPGTVHVICGENGAGKSTLMKVLNGTHQADSGEVWFKGKKIEHETIDSALGMGIAMIYQELNPILDMTVAENIFLGREPLKGPLVDFKKLYDDTQELLFRLDMPYNAKQKMHSLSIAGHQLIEIAKAISREASVIIMDEPTSAIADAEVAILFAQIQALKERGVAVIYITHKMDEIFKIADDITIIRDGKWVDSGPASNYNPNKLVSLMVGREISTIFPKDETVPIGDVVLEVKDLTQGPEYGGRFSGINFDLRAGEIVGFAGLVGAGRSEVMRAVFGLDRFSSGTIVINGEPIKIRNTTDAIKNGIAMISEDRKMYGLALGRNIHENISLVNLKKYVKKIVIHDGAITRDALKMKDLLSIKIPSFKVEANTLSGGNQQKVVLAKWLTGEVKIMILDEPTRGIDVGAKAEIHRLMGKFARQGMAIIMISSELPEIIGMSDRIVVMREGRINGILSREEATQESIMRLATQENMKQAI
ncbi:MAG: sugar ABC transporter ATP-binding protein [Treponema sp.]|jgi:inositol transport system ATP-binding protein|nr:sugar ABC transporter ATP-binding protein [Treponema sp.]